jgi:hypothetical protein
VLVDAADLEQVEEVGAGRVDLDEVLGGVWDGGWDFGDFEVQGSLYINTVNQLWCCSMFSGVTSDWTGELGCFGSYLDVLLYLYCTHCVYM